LSATWREGSFWLLAVSYWLLAFCFFNVNPGNKKLTTNYVRPLRGRTRRLSGISANIDLSEVICLHLVEAAGIGRKLIFKRLATPEKSNIAIIYVALYQEPGFGFQPKTNEVKTNLASKVTRKKGESSGQ
jgi:hypothetical protein